MTTICHRVSVKNLIALTWNPLEGTQWSQEPIPQSEIDLAIRENRLEPMSWEVYKDKEDARGAKQSPALTRRHRDFHIRRIAYLVVNPDHSPLDLEIEIPGYSFSNQLLDGWHRFSSAVVRGDEKIVVAYSGGCESFESFFPEAEKFIID